jgi:hypothetical protein
MEESRNHRDVKKPPLRDAAARTAPACNSTISKFGPMEMSRRAPAPCAGEKRIHSSPRCAWLWPHRDTEKLGTAPFAHHPGEVHSGLDAVLKPGPHDACKFFLLGDAHRSADRMNETTHQRCCWCQQNTGNAQLPPGDWLSRPRLDGIEAELQWRR